MKISQLSNDKVMISLCSDDMKSFELDYEYMGLSDPHSKKIISRLLSLACSTNSIKTDDKVILCEALKSGDGCVLLVSFKDKKIQRKKYRIKRIKDFPCYKFNCVDDMLTAMKKLYSEKIFFYNNSLYYKEGSYYLVFDYPVVNSKAKKILSEFSHLFRGTKTFVARLHESAKMISSGNAIVHIGAAL